MAWFTYHETATGKLLSIASTSVAVPPGVTRTEFVTRPSMSVVMWDEATASFVSRPSRVWVDRSDDVLDDPRLSTLSVGIKNQVRNVIDDVFGRERWRANSHPVNIGGQPGDNSPPS